MGQDLLEARAADTPGGFVDDTHERHFVVLVQHETGIGESVFDLLPLGEPEGADEPKRYMEAGKNGFEDPGLVVVAVQDRRIGLRTFRQMQNWSLTGEG